MRKEVAKQKNKIEAKISELNYEDKRTLISALDLYLHFRDQACIKYSLENSILYLQQNILYFKETVDLLKEIVEFEEKEKNERFNN